MADNGEDWGADCHFCGAPDGALCHCEGQRLRARVAELEGLQAHRDHSPCAIRILREFYSDKEAHGIAMEFTCFPMDCDTASKQAVEFLAKSKVTETEETTGEKRRQRFLASPKELHVVIPMDDAELLIFTTFLEEELAGGALSFPFPHPRLGTNVTVALREVPDPIRPEGATTYLVVLKLEILP